MDEVSIAKAIPSLLEHWREIAENLLETGFNRESDSVTVGASVGMGCKAGLSSFNRESDSVTVGAKHPVPAAPQTGRFNRESDSVTVGAKAILAWGHWHNVVSIAKAIPSLLERYYLVAYSYPYGCFNRESDSVTVGA